MKSASITIEGFGKKIIRLRLEPDIKMITRPKHDKYHVYLIQTNAVRYMHR